MFKLKLIVDGNERWLNKLQYDYFCPVTDNEKYYRKFLHLNFPFGINDDTDLSPYYKSCIPSIKPNRLDQDIESEALRVSKSDFRSISFFADTPKTPKEKYYNELTQLRYRAGLDHGIIPNIDRKYDRFIRPQQAITKPLEYNKFGGIFNLELESSEDDDFWYTWMLSSELKNGRIEFYEGDGDMAFKIQFWDCFCIGIGEQMSSFGRAAMTMQMRLSPAITQNRNVQHEKVWKITDITPSSNAFGHGPVGEEPVQEPEWVESYITDRQGNSIDNYEVGDTIIVVFKTRHLIGKKISLNLNDKDADFKYNGNRLENDILSNYFVNNNTEQVELTVIEQA